MSKRETLEEADFGKLLRTKRASAGLTVRQLSSATSSKKKSKSTVKPRASIALISLLESGKRVPTYEVAKILAAALDLDTKTALEAAYRSRVNHLNDCIDKESTLLEEYVNELP